MEDLSFQDLKKRVDHLQYDEINPIKEELTEIKISLSNNDLLTKQNIESNKKLNDTMDTLKTTMIEIAQSVRDSNNVTKELTETVEKLSSKVSSIEVNTKNTLDGFDEKLDKIDEKSKIDMLSWLKSNWFSVVLGLGALSYVITQLIKH